MEVARQNTGALPIEIWSRIFGELDLISAGKASLVCKEWAEKVPQAALSQRNITRRAVKLIREGRRDFTGISDIGLVSLLPGRHVRPMSWYLRNEEPWTCESVRELIQMGVLVTRADLSAAVRSGCNAKAFSLLLGTRRVWQPSELTSALALACHAENRRISRQLKLAGAEFASRR